MKKLIFILLLASGALNAQSSDFPRFQNVVEAVYALPDVPYSVDFKLEKRPEGYLVYWLKDLITPASEPQLLWSAEKQTYLPVTPPAHLVGNSPVPVGESASDRAANYVLQHRFLSEEMDRLPYYGYMGWYNDVIRQLAPRQRTCSDEQLFALSTAYSDAASGLLSNNRGFADTAQLFHLPARQPSLTAQQIVQYQALKKNSIHCLEVLTERSPAMTTRVGSIRTKYANEVMSHFLTMWQYQDLATAMKQLQRGLYDTWQLQSARNILRSCPPDAVLMTYGDTDTYTLLYVQATEDLRTDVLVVNTSLLQTARYYSAVIKGMFKGSNPLATLLPDYFFENTTILFPGGQNAHRMPINATAFLKELHQLTPQEEVGWGYHKLSIDNASVRKLVLPNPGNRLELASYWNYAASFLPMDQLAMLDILTANNWERPLCYALTCRESTWEPFKELIVQQGLVYRVTAGAHHNPQKVKVNTDEGAALWQLYDFDTQTRLLEGDHLPFYVSFVIAGKDLCAALLEEKGPEVAMNTARLLDKYFPDTQYPRGEIWLSHIATLVKARDRAAATALANQIWSNCKTGKLGDDALYKQQILQRVEAIAQEYALVLKR